jgi:hypothetical protein
VNRSGADWHLKHQKQVPAFDPCLPYQLSPHIYLLTDLHDSSFFLKKIECKPEKSQLLDESQAGERTDYLINVAGESTTYRMDAGVKAILGLFERPRTCRDAANIIREATGLPDLGESFFKDLVGAGIIVPNSASAATTNEIPETMQYDPTAASVVMPF